MEKGDGSSNNMPKTELQDKDATTSAEEHISRAQLKMQFHGTRKGEDVTMEAYITQLKDLADSLAAIGSPISDQDMVLQLLAGLPCQHYSPFQKEVSSQLPLPTFSNTCYMLSMYEKSLKEQTNRDSASSIDLEAAKEILVTILNIASKVNSCLEIWNMFKTGTASGNNKKYSAGQGGRGRNRNRRSSGFRNSAPK